MGDGVQFRGRGDQLGRHARRVGLGLEQHAQKVGQCGIAGLAGLVGLGLGQILGFDPCLDGGQDAIGDIALARFPQQQAGPAQVGLGQGLGRGDLDHRVVLQHAGPGNVAFLGIGFAEPGQFAQDCQEARRVGAGPNLLPGFLGTGDIGFGVFQDRDFLGQPAFAAVLAQLGRQKFIDDPQMRHIGQGIGGLSVRQGTARPVGKARRLVQVRPRDPAHQGFIACLFAEPADHRGHLGVEQGLRKQARVVKEDLQILAGGVEHLDRTGVAEQVIKRLQRQAFGQGIDQNRLSSRGAGGRCGRKRKLDQAQLGPIGPLAQEFGIDRDIGGGFCDLAETRQVFGPGDGGDVVAHVGLSRGAVRPPIGNG